MCTCVQGLLCTKFYYTHVRDCIYLVYAYTNVYSYILYKLVSFINSHTPHLPTFLYHKLSQTLQGHLLVTYFARINFLDHSLSYTLLVRLLCYISLNEKYRLSKISPEGTISKYLYARFSLLFHLSYPQGSEIPLQYLYVWILQSGQPLKATGNIQPGQSYNQGFTEKKNYLEEIRRKPNLVVQWLAQISCLLRWKRWDLKTSLRRRWR